MDRNCDHKPDNPSDRNHRNRLRLILSRTLFSNVFCYKEAILGLGLCAHDFTHVTHFSFMAILYQKWL